MNSTWQPQPNKTYARVGVRAIILNAKNELLLLKRTPDESWPGLWDFAGGSLEYGEQLPEGIAREVFEETGFSNIEFKLLTIESYIKDDGDFLVMVAYVGRTDQEIPTLSEREHDEYRWVTAQQAMDEENMFYVHKKLIQAWMDQGK